MSGFIASSQNLQTLTFFNGSNGMYPSALTMGNDGNLYGTTSRGGNTNLNNGNGYGTVFQVTTNGILTTLVSFNGTNGGSSPNGLTLGNDGNFYGTTAYGGSYYGTVFQVTTNGTLTTLLSFNGLNGEYPYDLLTLGADGNFYGTTSLGGMNHTFQDPSGAGTVFQVTTNGTLTTLISFAGNNNGFGGNGLTLGNDGNFYGTTPYGGDSNLGSVVQVTTNGTLTTLVSFNGANGANNNGNGIPQNAKLTLGNDGNFYGYTPLGGNTNLNNGNGYGTVFQVTTNGILTTLVSFNGTNRENGQNGLTLGNDGNFYGTTFYGGSNNLGTIFQMTTNGTLTTLVSFNANTGYGAIGLTLGNDGNFYGTTGIGGNTNLNSGYGYGTVFRLSLSTITPPPITTPTLPRLTLQFLAGYPLLTLYGTLGDTYTIQCTTNLAVPNWTSMLIVPNLSISRFQMIDPTRIGLSARFYRALQQ